MDKKKILLVEDDEILGFTIKNILTNSNYECIAQVDNGNEAIVLAVENKPDLILMDISLEGDLTGIETAIKIREKIDLPIIFITSYVNQETFNTAIGTEPYGFILKPINKNDLNFSIEMAFKKFEKDQVLKKEKKNLMIMFSELEETNTHLVSATFRERDMKKKLEKALDEIANLSEIAKAKEIIEEQNKKINGSINYAQKIQQSLLINEDQLKQTFNDSFLFFKPKDVVSGDFPWLYENADYIYFAIGDCTGHGVPGAMMSMLSCVLLNQISKYLNNPLPGEILDHLHKEVISTLKQDVSKSNSNDGLDIGLVRIDKNSNTLIFSGAHRPLLLLKNGELELIKGEKFPIGGLQYDKKRTAFTNNEISYSKGDLIFLYTDGLPDQVGGEEGRKYSSKNVEEILNSVSNFDELYNAIYNSFEKWMVNYKQVDDMLLAGIKL